MPLTVEGAHAEPCTLPASDSIIDKELGDVAGRLAKSDRLSGP
jgi:hypothetical protein